MRSSAEIKAEIEKRFGFFPPFFEPALPVPLVLENLWQQTLLAYVENPLPDLFKEKLAASLARYCSVPYCLVCHSSALRPLGMKATDVLEMLKQDVMNLDEIEENVRWLDNKPISEWPEAGSLLEVCIISCCVSIFLDQHADKCHEKLRRILDVERYSYLVSFLAYNRTCLSWAEAYPELSYEADERVKQNLAPLLEQEPALAEFFQNFREIAKDQLEQRASAFSRESKKHAEKERQALERLQLAQERFDRVADALEVGVMCCDIKTLGVSGNDRFREHLMLTSDARLTVETLLERVDLTDRDRAREACEAAIRSGEIVRFIMRTSDPDNRERSKTVQLAGWATYDGQGKPKRFDVVTSHA